MSCCIHYSRKLLPSTIRIDHFLDTRTIKNQARNYVFVTSFQLQKRHPLFTCCDVSFFDICMFICVY